MPLNSKPFLVLFTNALILLLTLACSPPSKDADSFLVITGSSTVAPIVAEVAQQYEDEHPEIRIDVQSGGSSRGIGDARSGLADIGMVSRALKGDENGLIAHPIARDGVALIVHASNPVEALSRDQVVALYRGKIKNWSELGGHDAQPVIVHKAEGRATLEVFMAYFGLATGEVVPNVVVGENEQGVKTTAGNKNAIAYVSIGTAAVDIDHGVPIKLVAVDGIQASLDTVRNGTYPISRPLNLVLREPAEGLAKDFLEYLASPAARPTFEKQSFVQITNEPLAQLSGQKAE